MEASEHPNTYIVRKDNDRFCVVEIDRDKVESYLHDLKKTMPQCHWQIEPRFPVNGAD
jgi:hypothetical protein